VAETDNEYRVKLPMFEGPFDLLLHLVKINEMEITDISLAQLTHQYLDYLALMKEMDLDVAGDFLVVAATLLQIKARYLLPVELQGDEEEEEEIDETLSARELMAQLIEYRSYKEVVAELQNLEQESSGVFYRHRLPDYLDPAKQEQSLNLDLQLLFDAMANVLRYIEKRDPHTELYEHYRVEDKIEFLEARLAETGELDVTQEFMRCLNKIEVIVTFLALLELVRLARVRVAQAGNYQAIHMYAKDRDTGDNAPTGDTASADEDAPVGGETPAAPNEESEDHEQETK
jgi:segregation and condensation protein A